MFVFFCFVFAMSLCASVYMCFVVSIPDICTLTYFGRRNIENVHRFSVTFKQPNLKENFSFFFVRL